MFRLPHGRRRLRRLVTTGVLVGAITAAVALALGSAGYAAAQMNVPCSAGGSGLVAAFAAANSSGGGTIKLDKGCTYLLTTPNNAGPLGANGLPVVTSTIVVKGNDATIAGNSTTFRLIQVNGPNGNLTLDHLTLTGGAAVSQVTPPASAGGALLNNEGTVLIDHSVVTGNLAGAGGGLASGSVKEQTTGQAGSLTVDHSVVSNNTAFGGGAGGILNRSGLLTVDHSRITGNVAPGGGGIATGPGNPLGTGSTTIVDHSQIDHNTAEEGAGIANGGILQVDHSDISDNTAPSTPDGSVGGGLFNHGSSATLDHSSVTGNTADFGGGIANVNFGPPGPTPQLTLSHSDVTGNVATTGGGGVVNAGGNVTLDHSNVSGNTPDNCAPPGAVPGCTG